MNGVLSDRAVLRLSGDESRAFLQGLVTQDVLSVRAGDAVFAALLTPQGKILFDFLLTPVEGGFLIDVSKSEAPALRKRLQLYKLRSKVLIDEEPSLYVRLGATATPVASYADPRHAALPRRSIAGVDAAAADDAYDELRLALGVPEFGKDFTGEAVYLLDVNYDALGGVSYKKGCFIGQEVTSRMKRKGEVRRRTLIANFDGAAPARGADILAGGTSIGEILSSRGGRALALVRLDRQAAARDAGLAFLAEGVALQLSFPDYLETV